MEQERFTRLRALEQRLQSGGATLYEYGKDFTSWDNLPSDTDVFVSIGGDGTCLESLTFVRDRQIPVVGINFGRLGFLTAASVGDESMEWVDDLLAGRFSVERRDLLKLEMDSVPADVYPYAFNEISVQRRGASMLSIDVKVDGLALPTYWADGLVVATPTGSTAYNLSVGGPIVSPSSKVLILSPIASHNLNVRPLVFPAETQFEMVFRTRSEDAVITLDNRSFQVASGVSFRVRKAEYGFNYVSFSGNSFIDALRTKLLWGEDRRNSEPVLK